MSIEYYTTYITDTSLEDEGSPQWAITSNGRVEDTELEDGTPNTIAEQYAAITASLRAGELLLENTSIEVGSATHYVPSGVITLRPSMSLTANPADYLLNPLDEDPEAPAYDRPTTLSISGIPTGSIFSTTETRAAPTSEFAGAANQPITANTLDITSYYEGQFSVTFENYPYIPEQITYETIYPGDTDDPGPAPTPVSEYNGKPLDIPLVFTLTGKSTVKGIVLEWDPISSNHYKEMNIYRRLGGTSDAYVKIGFAQAASQYTDGDVLSSTDYDYKVRAYSKYGIEYQDSNLITVTSAAVEQEDLGDSIGGDNYDFTDATDFVVTNYLSPSGSEVLWYMFLVGDTATNGLLATIEPTSEIKDPSYVFNTTTGNTLRAEVVFKVYEQPVGTADPNTNLTLKATSPTFVHWEAVEGTGVTVSDLLLSWSYVFGISDTQQYVLGVFYDKDRDASLDALSMVSSLRAYNITAA